MRSPPPGCCRRQRRGIVARARTVTGPTCGRPAGQRLGAERRSGYYQRTETSSSQPVSGWPCPRAATAGTCTQWMRRRGKQQRSSEPVGLSAYTFASAR